MDAILKYLSLISVAGAAIAFAAGFWKYLDQRAREERTKRFELYHGLMRRVSAFGESESETLTLTEQCAAIYELRHFRDYAYASVPILQHLRETYQSRSSATPQIVFTAIDATLGELREPKRNRMLMVRADD